MQLRSLRVTRALALAAAAGSLAGCAWNFPAQPTHTQCFCPFATSEAGTGVRQRHTDPDGAVTDYELLGPSCGPAELDAGCRRLFPAAAGPLPPPELGA